MSKNYDAYQEAKDKFSEIVKKMVEFGESVGLLEAGIAGDMDELINEYLPDWRLKEE